ncbi:acyl-CoA dehydrogenase [Chthonomonas calidirosea]|uniref:acyl-CoA dehydrogenase family protein n=1 Tax=Chthonomonas calidirosea TaxID=454171 RepID=UPI0006DD3A49|nr:acyl-CoA dehydrogenase family protein [Chthonomonas calidirosea]CEK17191.1 acyl-CoA dehydrogenase [Chthonomonas calidirosea]CEK17201.1 acyl-CoA dehydrogenase [Chthonomonas calidirosea]
MASGSCGPTDNTEDAVGLPIPESAHANPEEEQLIAKARQIAEEVLLPNAERSDQAEGPNRENFRALAEAGLLGIALPKEYGGSNVSGETQRAITEILASACGVTTFVQAQHHGPSRMIANGPNPALKERLVPELAAGRMLCGVSFAHLRRPGPPVLRAEPVPGGYRLYGTAPWVTGWGLMNQVVFGATLPDERFVYVWVPAHREEFPELFEGLTPPDGDWGRYQASPPLRLCAMNASATVTLTLEGLFVPEAHRLQFSDRETLRCNDRKGVLGGTALPMGCAAGAVRLLCSLAEKRPIPAIRQSAEHFTQELARTRRAIAEWNARNNEPDFFEKAVRLRAHAIRLAVRAAHAAVAASSGAANLLSNPAQRLFREAMFYTVQAQTQEVMAATLQLLEEETLEDLLPPPKTSA